MPKQSCNWCFTINNPSKVKTCGEKDKFKDLTFDTDEKVIKFIMQYEEVNYYVFQRERGHNENTEHIQGFIQFKNRKRGTTLQNMFPHSFFTESSPTAQHSKQVTIARSQILALARFMSGANCV